MDRKVYGRFPKRRVYIADLAALTAAWLIALIIRYDVWDDMFDRLYITLIISMCLIQTVIFVLVDLRRRSIYEQDPFENLISVLRDRTIVMVMTVIYLYVTKQGEISSRFVIFAIYLLSIVFQFIIRMMLRHSYLKRAGGADKGEVIEIKYPYPDREGLDEMIERERAKLHGAGAAKRDGAGTERACEILVHRSGATDEEYDAALRMACDTGARVYAGLQIPEYEVRSGIAGDVSGFTSVPVEIRQERFEVFGVRYAVCRTEEAVLHVLRHLKDLSGQYICFSNVHTLIMARESAEYRDVLNGSAITFPDGNPIAQLQLRAGLSGVERVAGPDYMDHVFRDTADGSVAHYFYGSKPETLEALGRSLREKYPDINICGMYSPPFRKLTPEEDEANVERINSSGADIVWVGLGAPKQERWMHDHAGRVKGVMMGVGAGFDFHAGTIRRAPVWIQKIGLEWLFRLFQDPGRLLKRYVVTNFKFFMYMIPERLRGRRGRGTDSVTGDACVAASGRPVKRVVMIGHKSIPSRQGGVEIVVDKLSTALAERGYEVEAYNRRLHRRGTDEYRAEYGHGDRKYYQGVRVRCIPAPVSSGYNAIVYAYLATIRALFGHYDVYHYHAEGPCAMLWLLKMFRKHIVVTIHGLDWQRAKWGHIASHAIMHGEKQAVKHADEIIVLSENVRDYFAQTYGRKTVFIPNGVDRHEHVPAEMIRDKYGLGERDYILFLARLVPEKGAHYLIEAYKQMDTDMKLVIAGGSGQADEYENTLRDMAAGDDRIIMTGFVEGRLLEELYSNAYVYVLPSDVEGMALSLLEAASYGNCCVVSDIPENTEVMTDHCVTFRHGDADSLRDTLKGLIDDPERVASLRESSADHICGRYSWDQMVDETERVYLK